MIRLAVPSIEEDDLAAVREVLETGFLVQGARVAAFEEALRSWTGTEYVAAVSNGTAALHLSLLALDTGPGDLVLVTAYSWPATANAIELCGARPVFVDIDPRTFNMDPARLLAELKNLASDPAAKGKVKAVLPIHAFGQMADMKSICEAADQFGIPVIEDAACALGAKWENRPAGAWGKLATFSFHPRKAVTTGEGGAISLSDPALLRKIRALRNHGLDPDASSPNFILAGFNYRLTEFQAALGVTQLRKMNRILTRRRELAAGYAKILSDSPVTPPHIPELCLPTYQSYVCLLPERARDRRAAVIAALKARGIETNIGTYHMPLIEFYRRKYGFQPGDFPAADSAAARAITLPLHETLTAEDQQVVVKELLQAVGV